MKKHLKILFTIIILLLILLPTQVQADSFKFNATANKNNVQPGETVTITLNVSDINAGELGINTVEAYLEYDSTIFEEVTQSDIESLNNWSITYNEEETEYKGKMLAVILQDGVTEDQNIGTITLKVKNGVSYTNTTITIKNIASNNGEELITETDKNILLEIGTKPQEEPSTDDDNDNDNNNNQRGNNGTENNGNSNNQQNSNTSKDEIPNTGTMNYLIVIISAVAIISGIVYLKYKQYKKIDN